MARSKYNVRAAKGRDRKGAGVYNTVEKRLRRSNFKGLREYSQKGHRDGR